MKFGFVTCIQLGKSCMDAIYQAGGQLDLVITLEDTQAVNKSGRVYLDEFCISKKVPLLKASHINNNECVEAIKKHKIDWLFIIGWSQITNAKILSAPSEGVLGIHPTLLPQGRGRAPIPWAILKALENTGVTLFKLDEGVDTGEIVDQLVIPLPENITATKLYELVNIAHIDLIKTVFPLLKANIVKLKKQDDKVATEWPGRVATDGEIDLEGSVYDAERLVRAVTRPYPGAYIVRDAVKYIIWSGEIKNLDAPSSETGHLFKDGFLTFTDYEVK
jgi:methionyl-tRNA formyltransferase